jgi:hypothetical protein
VGLVPRTADSVIAITAVQNAWVEQKNWTHVRKVVGYRRFDTTSELRLLIEITAVLPLYKNFCLPTIRLQSKIRGQGRIKVYDRPCTL